MVTANLIPKSKHNSACPNRIECSMFKYTKILNRSQIISFKIIFFLGGQGPGAWPDVSKMMYFLKQDNWVCIINNQLKFDI